MFSSIGYGFTRIETFSLSVSIRCVSVAKNVRYECANVRLPS